MPGVSRIAIRLALAWLVCGALVGWLIALARTGAVGGGVFALLPLHNEALIVGWFVQFVLATAFWMLPKHSPRDVPEPELRRGNARVFAAGVALIDVGVLATGVAAAASVVPAATAGRVASVVGVVLCVSQLWPRAKGFGR